MEMIELKVSIEAGRFDALKYFMSTRENTDPQKALEKTLEEIQRLVKENMVGEIVVGLPKNMDGSEGARAELCRGFADRLKEVTGLPVALWDERRTTVDAHRILFESGKNAKKRKQTVDAVAASLILEGYLDLRRLQKSREQGGN